MAEIIRMPKMSDTMQEGVIASWLVNVGDKVKAGDILAEVETDKATMELESYFDGFILHIGVQKGQAVPIDGIIAVIGKQGEAFEHLLNGNQENTTEQQTPQPQTTPSPVNTDHINAKLVLMPKMSDTMQEGTIASWLVNVGDKVKAGDILAEVETDKATMELDNYEDGYVLYIGAQAGQAVPIDGIIAVIGQKDANFQALIDQHQSGGKQTVAPQKTVEQTPTNTQQVQQSTTTQAPVAADRSSDARIKISPLARKLAKEKGFDIAQIQGSGENGRIVKKDVENFVPQTAKVASAPLSTSPVGEESYTDVMLSQMRKTIARRLAESKFSAPHFYLTMEINMDKAIEVRKSVNEFAQSKISFNDLVVKAAAIALKKHPEVNASWLEDRIRYNQHVHIGVAVAIPDGLVVPVVRFADAKSLTTLSTEIKTLGTKAKEKTLQPKDWQGNTFTISNLGMFGIEEFTAIINPPDACILAVGGIKQCPIVKDGQIQVGNVMKVTLSCDHRVVDGAIGAAFLQTLKALLEDPIRMLA